MFVLATELRLVRLNTNTKHPKARRSISAFQLLLTADTRPLPCMLLRPACKTNSQGRGTRALARTNPTLLLERDPLTDHVAKR